MIFFSKFYAQLIKHSRVIFFICSIPSALLFIDLSVFEACNQASFFRDYLYCVKSQFSVRNIILIILFLVGTPIVFDEFWGRLPFFHKKPVLRKTCSPEELLLIKNKLRMIPKNNKIIPKHNNTVNQNFLRLIDSLCEYYLSYEDSNLQVASSLISTLSAYTTNIIHAGSPTEAKMKVKKVVLEINNLIKGFDEIIETHERELICNIINETYYSLNYIEISKNDVTEQWRHW